MKSFRVAASWASASIYIKIAQLGIFIFACLPACNSEQQQQKPLFRLPVGIEAGVFMVVHS